MKITKIKAQQLAVPLIHPYVLSKEYGVYSTATPVIVTVYTDEDDIVGSAPISIGPKCFSIIVIEISALSPVNNGQGSHSP